MQRYAQWFRSLERYALQSDGELVNLRIPAELLWLPQRTGNVDRPPNRRIAGDALHMEGAEKGSDIEVSQDQLGLSLKVAVQGGLAFDL